MATPVCVTITLNGRKPAELKVAELKLWLQERRKSTKGKRPILWKGKKVYPGAVAIP